MRKGWKKLEEEVDYDPAALTLSDDSTQTPVRTTSGKEKKKKSISTVVPRDVHIRSVESRDIKTEKVEYEEVNLTLSSNSTAEQVDRETAAPEVEELETLLQTLPNNKQVLQDLLVNKNLSHHVTEGPVDIRSILAENPDLTEDIVLSLIDQIIPDSVFVNMFLDEYPDGIQQFKQT